jgi:hypothetical protein
LNSGESLSIAMLDLYFSTPENSFRGSTNLTFGSRERERERERERKREREREKEGEKEGERAGG